MKKTILLVAIIGAFSLTSTYAQNAPAKEDKKEARGERRGPGGGNMMVIYKDLNLTQEQEGKIKAINDEQREKMMALRNDNSLTDDARREKMRALMQERQEKINAVLTKEQQEKLAAKMKERGDWNGPQRNKKKEN
ncbi:hypothetical protein PIECOFPK_01044 [Mycovorax composti]|jgi:hypothetical protein|uniref:Uncharacterized protein n=2 Tax=Chitinophagaceae TaxID=563835 RepID=A0ABZ2EIN5_9BACT